jgi:hypothetical protein
MHFLRFNRLLILELRSNDAGIRRSAQTLLSRHVALVTKYATITLQRALPLAKQSNLLPAVWALLNEDIVGECFSMGYYFRRCFMFMYHF